MIHHESPQSWTLCSTMAYYLDTALTLLSAGFGVYAHHRSLSQEKSLHEHECATSTEQHFASLSAELLAIAKEADRDVWEQRNSQFNNLLVCAVLMFGVAVGNINEGTYKFDQDEDMHGLEARSLWSRDGSFVLLSGISIGSLFICISACLIVMRRMSSYMIERSSNLVDRLAVSSGLAHHISGSAQAACAEHGDRLLGSEKRTFHEKMGSAIGSGPKEAAPRTRIQQHGTGAGKEDRAYQRFVEPPRTLQQPSERTRLKQAPLNFSIFYREHCVWLSTLSTWSFVVGVLSAWSSVGFLLWNQFPHLMLPVLGFAAVGLVALSAAFRLEVRTRRGDRNVALLLRKDGSEVPWAAWRSEQHRHGLGGGIRGGSGGVPSGGVGGALHDGGGRNAGVGGGLHGGAWNGPLGGIGGSSNGGRTTFSEEDATDIPAHPSLRSAVSLSQVWSPPTSPPPSPPHFQLAPQPSPQPAPDPPLHSYEDRLRTLIHLHELGLISPAEHQAKREMILAAI